ncbi:AMP nucleosidase, partial [Novosphingobium sp.]
MEMMKEALAELVRVYDAAVACLKADIIAFVENGTLPPPERRAQRLWTYPELRVTYHGQERAAKATRAFGRLEAAGTYCTTVTRPHLFADYLTNQLALLEAEYEIELKVTPSAQEIPFPYVLDGVPIGAVKPQDLAQHFPSTDLAMIGDEIADGAHAFAGDDPLPLALFDGLRTDFSLARLAHYTGTSPEHCQRFILFTNYHRYVDEFVDWAGLQIGTEGYVALSGAGGLYLDAPIDNARARLSDTAWRRHQMPAYHLIKEDRSGITLVNIGVGPSNAKTITDHLAVLRPEAWLMIGHCGGLRDSQRIGDYVLAHAYLRDDHVLDPVLPPEIPLPAIAEVQQALAQAAEIVSGGGQANLKKRMRTGTVVTTDDRNWELRYTASARRFSLSRAIGIDMESATISA